MKNTTKFRQLMDKPGTIFLPGAYDALGAKVMEQAGFDAIYMSGNTTAASMLGAPDMGLITATEMIWRAQRMASAVNVPLICDADTGYGNYHNVMKTVRDFEDAGIAGIHFEDQAHPHKCGSMAGVEVVSLEESVTRIEAALKARRDPDFVIIARTDARTAVNFDEAIKRCKAFSDVGADMVFIVGLKTFDEIKEASIKLKGISQFHLATEWRPWSNLPLAQVNEMGFKAVCFAMTLTLMIAKTMLKCANHLKNVGDSRMLLSEMLDFHKEYHEGILGLSEFSKIEKQLTKK
jgi:2,3-dimethylmalate lyase